ncbi:hypothetical protein [Streptomyces collinus]|uniref:hypothetical protein n=1 Tax=Streptomyces collinus TaxID=42684 RepID=UPI0029438B87|nr:hypothetical protein [Streptomyces collinus]
MGRLGSRRLQGPRRGARLLALGLALSAPLLTTGCGRTGGADPATGGPVGPASSGHTAHGSVAPSPSSGAQLCAEIVAHWSRKVLDSGTYGDYQSMGLSNGQYEILRAVVAAARAAERRQGAAAADELIVRRARTACVDRYRHGVPGEGPWR